MSSSDVVRVHDDEELNLRRSIERDEAGKEEMRVGGKEVRASMLIMNEN